jgi:hypothetical protein
LEDVVDVEEFFHQYTTPALVKAIVVLVVYLAALEGYTLRSITFQIVLLVPSYGLG